MKKSCFYLIPFMLLIMLAIINSGRAIGATGGLDSDGDGVLNSGDNCPLTANPDQADANGNGIGDVCDAPFPGAHFDPGIECPGACYLTTRAGTCCWWILKKTCDEIPDIGGEPTTRFEPGECTGRMCR